MIDWPHLLGSLMILIYINIQARLQCTTILISLWYQFEMVLFRFFIFGLHYAFAGMVSYYWTFSSNSIQVYFVYITYYVRLIWTYCCKLIETRSPNILLESLDLSLYIMSGKVDTPSFPSDETEIHVFIDRISTRQRTRHSSKQTEYNNNMILYFLTLAPSFVLYR